MALSISASEPRVERLLVDGINRASSDTILAALILGADPTTRRASNALFLVSDKPIVLEALLKLGVNPDLTSQPLLHNCIDHWHVKAIELLVECGRCNPNRQDENGNTALHHLASKVLVLSGDCAGQLIPLDRTKKAELIDYLVKNAADKSIGNSAGKTPIQLLPSGEHASSVALSQHDPRERM